MKRTSEEWMELVRRGYPDLSPEDHGQLVEHIIDTHPSHQVDPVRVVKSNRGFWMLIVILILLLVVAFMAGKQAHAQLGTSQIDVITIQSNGSNVKTFAAPFRLNFSGCTVTASGSTVTISACSGGGTGVSSITWSLPAFMTATPSTISSAGTQTFSFNSQSQNLFFASPNGSSGAPAFRAIVAADVPTLNQNTTGTAANVTGSSNSTLTTLSGLSLPYSQLTGTPTIITSSTLVANQAVNGLGSTSIGSGFTGTAGTITFGHIAAYTASGTIGNCATTPCVNALGIFNSSSTWLASGEVSVSLDGTVNVTAGDILCNSSSGSTAHDNGTIDCATGQRIGYVKTTASSVSSATVDLVRN